METIDPETLKALKEVATDAIKILGPAAFTAFVAVRVARFQIAVEKIKLHDKDRTVAHKNLFVFAKRIENATFPMAEEKDADFRRIMQDAYCDRLQMDLIYFSDEVAKILDRFEEKYICMTRGELVGETQDEVAKFLEERVFDDARKLAALARKAMREVKSST